MKTAIITGGAGGLGRAMAAELGARGWHCALFDLPGALARVPASGGISLHPCDVTDAAQVAAAVAQVRAQRPGIDMAIHNAGITLIAPFDRVDTAAHRRVFEVNYWGAVHLAQAVLPDIRASRGVHLALTSVAGFAPLKHRTAYAASKHAMTGFFASLRGEEAEHGVRVVLAAPSFVATNPGAGFGADGIGPPGAARDGVDQMTPAQAARVIIDGALAGRAMVPVGRVARLAWWAMRLAPGFYERQMVKRMGRESS